MADQSVVGKYIIYFFLVRVLMDSVGVTLQHHIETLCRDNVTVVEILINKIVMVVEIFWDSPN